MTLARLFVGTHTTVRIQLDTHPDLWYNARMTTDSPSISDTLARINLITHPVHQGFTMTFPNRVTVSIRWGEMNHSDGRTTAECAAWNADTHKWIHVPDFGSNDVVGHMNTHEIARFMYNASQMTL